jgi:transposase
MVVLMSMQPQPWPGPSPDVAAAVRAMYRRRRAPLAVVVRDELGELFADERFAAGFGVRGRRGWSPGRLALVTALQMAENLTDRQAAEAVRLRIDWKYALGLALTEEGFDASVLSEFRARVLAHGLEETALDLLLAALVDKELVRAGGRQRTDSTHVVAAVRELNRLELAGEAVRAACEALAAAAPGWLAGVIDVSGWNQRYGQRVDSWRLPTSRTKRAELASAYGADGFTLLRALYAAEAPGWLARLPAVHVLRRVLLQNYTVVSDQAGQEVVTWREPDVHGLPPGRYRIVSPYDTEARTGGKRGMYWRGYKLHISETCTRAANRPEADTGHGDGPDNAAEPDRSGRPRPATDRARQSGRGDTPLRAPPHIITHVATTDASVPDNQMTASIHSGLHRRGLLPEQHLVDSGYPSADLLVSSQTDYGITLLTPMLADNSTQARAGTGYDSTAFTIDFDNQQATCPQGTTSTSWNPGQIRGNETINIRFPAAACRTCPVRHLCTTSHPNRGRQLSIRPQPVHTALTQARAYQHTESFKTNYRLRAGAEATISQAVAVTGTRRTRYRGLGKTHLEHVYSAVALNLIRLDAWLHNLPTDPTRTTHLARLEQTLAA